MYWMRLLSCWIFFRLSDGDWWCIETVYEEDSCFSLSRSCFKWATMFSISWITAMLEGCLVNLRVASIKDLTVIYTSDFPSILMKPFVVGIFLFKIDPGIWVCSWLPCFLYTWILVVNSEIDRCWVSFTQRNLHQNLERKRREDWDHNCISELGSSS
mgnify:CR=1 FL=1